MYKNFWNFFKYRWPHFIKKNKMYRENFIKIKFYGPDLRKKNVLYLHKMKIKKNLRQKNFK